jgi:hypothetical protein
MHPFTETQKFDQWWLKVILAIPVFELLAFALNDYQTKGDIQTDSLLGLVIVGLVIILLWVMSLTTHIDETGIQYRFFPFHLKDKTIAWSEIESAVVREYSPLREYGGWGIRRTFRNGVAYNVKGKFGLQLELKNGKRILIGTSENQRLTNYLEDLKKLQPITALN